MEKLNVVLQGATMLSKSEMKSVKGGSATFFCRCNGSGSGTSGEIFAFAFEADSTMNLIDRIDSVCGDRGGTCNSISN